MSHHANWLGSLFKKDERVFVVERLVALIEHSGVEFSHIAVCGISGVGVGSIVAHVMNKSLIVVRKESDDNHSDYAVEVDTKEPIGDFIIIDDLISSGATVQHILDSIEDLKLTGSPSCVHGFLYHDGTSTGWDFPIWGFYDSLVYKNRHDETLEQFLDCFERIPEFTADNTEDE